MRRSAPGCARYGVPCSDSIACGVDLDRTRPSGSQQRALYHALIAATRHTVQPAERVRRALADRAPQQEGPRESLRLSGRLQTQLDPFLPLVQRVMEQARSRVLEGRHVSALAKILSLVEPQTRVIPRHTGGAAVEFGRQVMLSEVEGGIVTRFPVLADGESDRRQALPAVEQQQRVFGRAPWLLTGDRGVPTKGVEEQAHRLGVTQVAIPRSGPTTLQQRARERCRAWRRRYRWRAGIEGRLSSLRRDYGLRRVRSHGLVGLVGLERDVGWGILASNLRHLAAASVGRTKLRQPDDERAPQDD